MLPQEAINVSLIELIAGFGYLFGHFLLSRKNIFGWIIKIIGGIAWIIFLLQNENYIFMTVTIVIVLTMIYGFYKWKTEKYDERTIIDRFFEISAIIVAMFMVSRFVLSSVYKLAPIFETVIVIAEILGTIFLAHKKIAGWYSYTIMSLLAGMLVIFINPNPFFCFCCFCWSDRRV